MPSLRCAWKEFRGESILQDVCDVVDRSGREDAARADGRSLWTVENKSVWLQS
jgi:hypothetical protein